MRHITLTAVLLALGVAAVSGCAATPAAAPQPVVVGAAPVTDRTTAASTVPATASFADSGVAVVLRLDHWNGADGVLTATFTPQRGGFHLYSISLPSQGIQGIGRPTAVALRGALGATGPLATTAPLHSLTVEGTTAVVPVYPNGPLITSLPVHATGAGAGTVLVSYAACSSSQGCMFPVSEHPVHLTVSAEGVSFATR